MIMELMKSSCLNNMIVEYSNSEPPKKRKFERSDNGETMERQ